MLIKKISRQNLYQNSYQIPILSKLDNKKREIVTTLL